MYPRHRLDLTSRHLLVAARACAQPPEADELERRVEGLVGPHALAFLTVRSAWGLVLDALDLPAGSEVLFSALTHPEMSRIAAERELVPVPVDLDPVTLAPDESSLERAVTSRSRVLVVAHLFGGRVDLQASAALAEKHGLVLVEDCAQSLRGPDDRGDDRATVSLFSFGAIKTATALGGALVHVRDPELRGRMWGLRSSWPRQEVATYATRVARFGALHALESPGVFSAFLGAATRIGVDQDALLAKAVRSSPARRLRPSAPLLALLGHRLRYFDGGRLRRRAERGEQLADALPPGLSVPGRSALDHTHWVVPVATPSPERLIESVRAAGFDANTATTSVAVVPAPPGRPEPEQAAGLLERIVFVPAYPELPAHAFQRLLETVRSQ
jgi:dTDP-4-amino-4,6-dideoxygalactose transaminase